MTLFFVGIVEMLIVTSWTKMVTKTQIFGSGVITMINVLVWYYVLQVILEDIGNWIVVVLYALGCSVGTMLTMYLFHFQEKRHMVTVESVSTT